MRTLTFSLLILLANVTFGAVLEDVNVLSITPGQNSIELKLQDLNGPVGSYFFLEIGKDDPESLEKTALAIKKFQQKDNYRLSLEIPSFSVRPSGSFYRSNDVVFQGSDNREPNSVKAKKGKKPASK